VSIVFLSGWFNLLDRIFFFLPWAHGHDVCIALRRTRFFFFFPFSVLGLGGFALRSAVHDDEHEYPFSFASQPCALAPY
jgi:hypothetical protein